MSNTDWIDKNVFFACTSKDFESELDSRGWDVSDVVSLEGTLGFCHKSQLDEVIRRFGEC